MKRLGGILIAICVAAVFTFARNGFLSLDKPARAQDDPAANPKVSPLAKARDKTAADAALAGWWTEAAKTRDQRVQWWRDAKFGCFIHWGVYADPAGEYKGRKG